MNGALVIGGGRVVLMILALASVRVSTELLPPGEVGRLSVLMAFVSVGSILVDRSVGAYWYRMLAVWERGGGARRELRTLIGLVCVAALGLAVLGMLVEGALHVTRTKRVSSLGGLIFLGIAGNCLFLATVGGLNILRHRMAFVACAVGSAGLGLFVASILAQRAPSAERWLVGIQLGQLGALLFALLLLRRRLTLSVAMTSAPVPPREWMAFALPSAFTAVLYGVQLVGYRLVLNAIDRVEVVASYAVAFGLGVAAMNAFDYFITQLLQPRLLREGGVANAQGAGAAWSEYAAAVVPAAILCAALVGAVAPILLRFGASSAFSGSGRLLVAGALVDGLRIIAQAVGMVAHLALSPRRLLVPTFIGVLTAFGSGVVLHRAFAPDGMALGMILGGIVWVVATVASVRSLLPMRLPIARAVGALIGGLALFGVGGAVPLVAADASRAAQVAALSVIGGLFVAMQYAFARRWLGSLDTAATSTRDVTGDAQVA